MGWREMDPDAGIHDIMDNFHRADLSHNGTLGWGEFMQFYNMVSNGDW